MPWTNIDGTWRYYNGQYAYTTSAPDRSDHLSDRRLQRLRTKLRRLAGAIQDRDDAGNLYTRYNPRPVR